MLEWVDIVVAPRGVSTRSSMSDITMLVLGIGAFALFLGYVSVCEIL